MVNETFPLVAGTNPSQAIAWALKHGYDLRSISSSWPYPHAYLIAKRGQPPCFAIVGQTLQWDGTTITITGEPNPPTPVTR